MVRAHKEIRAALRLRLSRPAAWHRLDALLPARERDAIYYADVEREPLMDVADRLCCTESGVKKLRHRGYGRLASLPSDTWY